MPLCYPGTLIAIWLTILICFRDGWPLYFRKENLMNSGLVVMSYTLSALSGICFITGLAVLFGGRSGKYGKF